MSEPNLDLYYTITIRGRLEPKDKSEQEEILQAAAWMAHSPPAFMTRSFEAIEITNNNGTMKAKIEKSNLNPDKNDHLLGL